MDMHLVQEVQEVQVVSCDSQLVVKKMMKRSVIALMVLAAALTACHDDGDTPVPAPHAGAWTVSVVGSSSADDATVATLGWRAAYESLTVSIGGRTAGNGAISVSLDAGSDWLSVASDTLASDSIVALTTKTNTTGVRREATLTFAAVMPDGAAPGTAATLSRASLRIVQLSQADESHNADARDQLFIGYGYDVYKALESPMAVRTRMPVIDYQRLREMSRNYGVSFVQDCHLAQTDVRYVASNSIHAFGRDLTEQQTGDTDNHFEGCSEDCKKAGQLIDPAKGELSQHNFGHGSIVKAVASRIVDRAMLIDMQRSGEIPFTADVYNRFYVLLNELKDPAERAKYIEQMLADYGTHVITQVDLGGRIDYTFTMQKSVSFNSVEEMKQEVDFTLGRIADTERTGMNLAPSSSKSKEGAITVKGGNSVLRTQLENDIRSLDGSGQISPSHLANWLASINYSQNFERDPSLDIIHFELIPLWDLVPSALRHEFMEATFRMAQRSDCQLPARFTGTDIYQIDAPEKALFDFSEETSNLKSLCRLLYIDDDPVMEVCSEYVPKIRTDQRVVIAYPIYKRHIRLNQGLFLGDGIHQPAYVGFSGADSYVDPIDSLATGRRITRFYYVNGSLMLSAPVSGKAQSNRTVADDQFIFNYGGETHRHPIVKVGAQFWTRRDIDHEMGFCSNPEASRPRYQEWLDEEGHRLYACFYRTVSNRTQKENDWTWGWKPNTFYDGQPNTRWYLPTEQDVRSLHAYLGFNPKALFLGQVSGFGAQFAGYYGIHDFLQNRPFDDGDNAVRYAGELSILGVAHDETKDNPLFLVIDRHYRLTLQEATGDFHRDYFPVRAVRGYMFEYPTLNTIKENIY